MGVDALHPLQVEAQGMEPEQLAADFSRDMTFIGGVSTQRLLRQGSPQEVREEVWRLRDLFWPGYVVSSSHEALLPDVPVENMVAMFEASTS
jgi:uroporphyrinogen decarboxylase